MPKEKADEDLHAGTPASRAHRHAFLPISRMSQTLGLTRFCQIFGLPVLSWLAGKKKRQIPFGEHTDGQIISYLYLTVASVGSSPLSMLEMSVSGPQESSIRYDMTHPMANFFSYIQATEEISATHAHVPLLIVLLLSRTKQNSPQMQ